MNKLCLSVVLIWTGFACLADEKAKCVEKGSNGMVTMLLCPEGLTDQLLAEEGRIACRNRKLCGAWIWTDATNIPDKAPPKHDELPQSAIRSAVAIWENENENLITVRRSEK